MSLNKIHNGQELIELPEEPNNYLIDGMLWENQCIMILAKEKVGKSIFALQMACSLSSGVSFLDHYEIFEPMKILYIQTESTRAETIERLKSMTKIVKWNPENFYLLYANSLALDIESGYNELVGQINCINIKPKVIFLDPLYMSMKGSLTDELSARQMCATIRKLVGLYDCACVIPHHEHRERFDRDHQKVEEGDNAIMGSFVWKSFVSHVLHLRKKQMDIRSLTCTTQRNDRVIRDMALKLNTEPLFYSILDNPDHPDYYNRVNVALVDSGIPMTAYQLMIASKLSEDAVRKALAYFYMRKQVMKTNPGRRPVLYAVNNSQFVEDMQRSERSAENLLE